MFRNAIGRVLLNAVEGKVFVVGARARTEESRAEGESSGLNIVSTPDLCVREAGAEQGDREREKLGGDWERKTREVGGRKRGSTAETPGL